METKKVRRRFELADYLEEERFLEEQHRNGWKMVELKLPLSTYIFERCGSEDYVYQLDFNSEKSGTESYVQLFEDCGWEYFYKFGNWYYFRKSRSEVESENVIFNDGPSRAKMAKKVAKFQAGLSVFLIFPLIYLLAVVSTKAIDSSLVLTIMVALIAIVMVISAGIQLKNMRKLNKIIEKEEQL
ncbi:MULTISPECIES: DUF2812 domain-containing protein [unclassified Enterococcus]|uniref:DUF2812 domain-containing protein n=1 Tax=unclassified Enterococcus TaxID=2608891 RepID=UPI001CE1FB53|nr:MULTISPECIES: DUF2812 domain-containing protein [unclassified Enterococcus]MCA5013785.1 DUF2812 domain-containing protein [Enterococcus sp. S23]MCA5017035.1 DUF2812 domain-containing protein [Enterococcus sp. S22(2020)]